MSSEDKQKTNLDDVLGRFGIFSRYQLQMLLAFALAYVSNTTTYSNYIFAAEDVPYRCADENFTNNTCGTIDSARCTEWVYDKNNSFIAEFQLACQDWKRTLVGTVHSSAYMLGLLCIGPMSDRFGRKTMMIAAGVIAGLVGVTKSFVTTYWLYIALEFFEAAFGDNYSPTYILNIEIISNKQRVPYLILANLGYCVGGVYIALLAWLLPNWRHFLRVLYGPALLFIFYIFVVDESPRWLLITGKKEKAVKIIKKIAKKNKVEIEQSVLDNLYCEKDKEESVKFLEVLKCTFSSPTLIKRFIICVVWWTTSTFVNFGLNITSVSLQGNSYANYALVSFADTPSSLLTMFVTMRYRRKYPLIISFLVAGLLCIGQPFLPNNLAWLSIVMYMCGKLMASLYFSITYIYTSELFPTYTRNSMLALCSSLGRIGAIVAPQTPLLTVYWEGLPSLLFGIVSIIAGLLTFLISDIADESLPDTVKEAEAIGNKETDEVRNNIKSSSEI